MPHSTAAPTSSVSSSFRVRPRHVDIPTALKLADRARGQAKIVALFVDPDDRVLDNIVDKVQPDYVQLHGDESGPRVREIKQRLHLPVIKAIRVGTAVDAARALRYNESADLILFDCAPAQGRAPARRQRPRLRLACARRGERQDGVHAVGRPDAGQRGRGDHGNECVRGRCVVWRRKRARREGSSADPPLPRRRQRTTKN